MILMHGYHSDCAWLYYLPVLTDFSLLLFRLQKTKHNAAILIRHSAMARTATKEPVTDPAMMPTV